MEESGIFEVAKKKEQENKKFFYRLVPSYTVDTCVSVEVVDEFGERIALLCRISQACGIERYEDIPKELGFPLGKNDVIISPEDTTV